jgi:hypothetical protein
MDEKPLSAIPQRRTLPPFKGDFKITFALDKINRQKNNLIALRKALKPCLLYYMTNIIKQFFYFL